MTAVHHHRDLLGNLLNLKMSWKMLNDSKYRGTTHCIGSTIWIDDSPMKLSMRREIGHDCYGIK